MGAGTEMFMSKGPTLNEMKARQSCKIRELGDALITAGFRTLDEQAKALGLGRSTTWTVLKGNHKASGLSTSIINRMLMSPQLPQCARTKIVEYVHERASGLHGHNQKQLRKFVGRLLIRWPEIIFVRHAPLPWRGKATPER
jgi:hypothetical protein